MIRTPSFVIRDIKGAKKEDTFVQRGIRFSDVYFCGAIIRVRVETVKDLLHENFIFTVNDNSGSIDCVLEFSPDEWLDPFQNIDAENLKKADPNNPLVAWCLVKGFEKVNYHDFKVGMWVSILGVLQRQNGVNYVIIKSIHKLDKLSQRISYFKYLDYLYNIYKNSCY